MLGRCRRRRPNQNQTLCQCFVLTGDSQAHNYACLMLGYCWVTACDGGPTLIKHWPNVSSVLRVISSNRARQMVDHCLKNRNNIWTTLVYINPENQYTGLEWLSAEPTSYQHWLNSYHCLVSSGPVLVKLWWQIIAYYLIHFDKISHFSTEIWNSDIILLLSSLLP